MQKTATKLGVDERKAETLRILKYIDEIGLRDA